MNQLDIERVVRTALAEVGDDLGLEVLEGELAPNLNIVESISSFAVVELLLTTESKIEELTGRYIPLADEKLFDAQQSPLISLQNWIDYVQGLSADA